MYTLLSKSIIKLNNFAIWHPIIFLRADKLGLVDLENENLGVRYGV